MLSRKKKKSTIKPPSRPRFPSPRGSQPRGKRGDRGRRVLTAGRSLPAGPAAPRGLCQQLRSAENGHCGLRQPSPPAAWLGGWRGGLAARGRLQSAPGTGASPSGRRELLSRLSLRGLPQGARKQGEGRETQRRKSGGTAGLQSAADPALPSGRRPAAAPLRARNRGGTRLVEASPPEEGPNRGGGRTARRSHPHTYHAGEEEKKKRPRSGGGIQSSIYSGAEQAHTPSSSSSRSREEGVAAAARGRAVSAAAAGPAAASPW